MEIWQANVAGRYVHLRDQRDAPLDPDFTGVGRVIIDTDERYSFVMVRPGIYSWGNHHNAWRPAHIQLSLFGGAITLGWARADFHLRSSGRYRSRNGASRAKNRRAKPSRRAGAAPMAASAPAPASARAAARFRSRRRKARVSYRAGSSSRPPTPSSPRAPKSRRCDRRHDEGDAGHANSCICRRGNAACVDCLWPRTG